MKRWLFLLLLLVGCSNEIQPIGDVSINATSPVIVVETYDDLASVLPRSGVIVRTLGHVTAGDGRGSEYLYDTSSTSWVPVSTEVLSPNQFGATPNDETDDTTAIQSAISALSTGGVLTFPPGEFVITAEIDIATDGVLIKGSGRGKTVLKVADGWSSIAVIEISADDCTVSDLEIVEIDAAPDVATGSGGGKGLSINGKRNVVERVVCNGFDFPFTLHNTGADDSKNNNTFRECVATNGYSWGFGVHSAKDTHFVDCIAFNNGLDGFKAGNDYDYSCDGLTYRGCVAYENGQRDISVGGSEDTNGNGFDIYDGGYRISMIGCRSYNNVGSSLNLKGGGGTDPIQGESVFVGCEFSQARTTNLAARQHGVEIGVNYDTGNSLLHFVACTFANNHGNGVSLYEGSGTKFSNCNFTDNGGVGLASIKADDVTISGCNFFRNKVQGATVGLATDGSFVSRRVVFTGCTFSGRYDPFLASSTDMRSVASTNVTVTFEADDDTWTATDHGFSDGDIVRVHTVSGTLPTGTSTTVPYWVINSTANTFQLTTNANSATATNLTSDGSGTLFVTYDGEIGIRTFSDSADVVVSGCSFMNHWGLNGTITSYAQRTVVRDTVIYGAKRVGVYVLAGDVSIMNSTFQETDFTASTSYGAIRVASTADVRDCNFIQSSSTANTKFIQFDSGSTLSRWSGLTGTNFPLDVTVTAGATWDPEWVQSDTGTTAPASGYHIAGAVRWNSAPATGQPDYWRCTAAGTPGTWEDGVDNP